MAKAVPIKNIQRKYGSLLRNSSKSQLFIFDLIFSVVVIIISLGIAFSYYSNTMSNADIYDLNSQILNGFTQTEINSLNSVEIRDLFISGEIKNIHNTIAQQVIDFIESGKIELAKNLTRIFVKDYITNQMNFNLTLINSSNFQTQLYLSNKNKIPFSESEITSDTKRKIISFSSLDSKYEIYTFEVKIWV